MKRSSFLLLLLPCVVALSLVDIAGANSYHVRRLHHGGVDPSDHEQGHHHAGSDRSRRFHDERERKDHQNRDHGGDADGADEHHLRKGPKGSHSSDSSPSKKSSSSDSSSDSSSSDSSSSSSSSDSSSSSSSSYSGDDTSSSSSSSSSSDSEDFFGSSDDLEIQDFTMMAENAEGSNENTISPPPESLQVLDSRPAEDESPEEMKKDILEKIYPLVARMEEGGE